MFYRYLPALAAAAEVTLLPAAEFATVITLAAATSPSARLVLPPSAVHVVAQVDVDVDVALGPLKVRL